jgi:hypothetical protein
VRLYFLAAMTVSSKSNGHTVMPASYSASTQRTRFRYFPRPKTPVITRSYSLCRSYLMQTHQTPPEVIRPATAWYPAGLCPLPATRRCGPGYYCEEHIVVIHDGRDIDGPCKAI